MSKKDYNKFANLFSELRPVKSDFETKESYEIRARQFEQLINGAIDIFAQDNTRFDVQRFKLAIYK